MNHNLKALTVWVLRYPRNTSSEGSQQISMLEFAAFLKFRPWNEEHERKLTSSPMIRVEHRGGRGVRSEFTAFCFQWIRLVTNRLERIM